MTSATTAYAHWAWPRVRHSQPETTEERAAALERIERLADFLDSRFSVLGLRFGWDAIIGLVPFVGDAAATTLSASIVVQGYHLGATKKTVQKMLRNLAIDMAVGSIPVAGSVFDFFFKANKRNLKLLRNEFDPSATP